MLLKKGYSLFIKKEKGNRYYELNIKEENEKFILCREWGDKVNQ